MDDENRNTLWKDTTNNKLDLLMDLDCFEFKPEVYSLGEFWQGTTLNMVFDAKTNCGVKTNWWIFVM